MTRPFVSVAVLGAVAGSSLLIIPTAPPPAASELTPTAQSAKVSFGAWVDGMMDRPRRLRRFERMVRHRTDIASYYYGFGDIFPGDLERRFAAGGRRQILISWHLEVDGYQAWAEGRHDDYLADVAAAARSYPHDVYIRPWAEMNGDWTDFQPTPEGTKPQGGTYAEFKAAWRHVVRFMRRHGADNLKWVFNPTADVYPETTPVGKIWPGRRYVDVLGIDGYNWGRDRQWGRWRSYRQVFGPMYRRLTRLHPSAPVWICEFGSKEPRVRDGAPRDRRHSKAIWLRNAFSFRGFHRVRALVYFHERKERDWRVNSSRRALRTLRRMLNVHS